MTERETRVEYRVIRPDGNLIWHAVVPSNGDFVWSVPADGVLLVDPRYPEVMPPWRIERREAGDAEWTLVAERGWTT